MKVDQYTKIVLTVIACALCLLVWQNALAIKGATAQEDGVQRVAICDKDGKNCASVMPSSTSINNKLWGLGVYSVEPRRSE